ncbi:MAG: aminoacyl-tRNA hydrolase [Spirochaetaceae bacterium]|nr:aminoacyl-tRNA hydrolase [Spirochaetaceae bacterium]
MIKMIVFLGNPGKQYSKTRHNVGWQLLEYKYNSPSFQNKFNGEVANEKGIKLLKPQTFMNESGRSVGAAAAYFNLSAEEILVVHDDLELPFGEIKIQKGGGLKGHNGLKSINTYLNDSSFYRLRFGIGRPQHGSVSSFVLSPFSKEESISLPIYFERASQEIDKLL